MSRFSEVIERMIGKNIPFFFYRLPDTDRIRCGLQIRNDIITGEIQDFTNREGFIMASFDGDDAFQICPDYLFDLPENFDLLEQVISSVQLPAREEIQDSSYCSSQSEYLSQCSDFIRAIKKNTVEKVILSRVVKSEQLTRKRAGLLFKSLCEQYLSAFIFLVHIPGRISWIGASPETLLKVEGNHFTTMSLAGTNKWIKGETDQVENWRHKDIEEQAIVTRYICNQLSSFSDGEIKCSALKVKRAGNICHLQTIIQGRIIPEKIPLLIKSLHPTPAVCGTPKDTALKLIRETERHKRRFYAGYLGFCNGQDDLELFVNLRSAQLFDNYGLVYVGGGITAESEPIKEWEETCLKSQTILNIIK